VALAVLVPRLRPRSAVGVVDAVPRPRRARPDGPDGVEEPKPSSGVKPNPTRLTNSPLIVRPVDSVTSKRRSFAPAVAGAATAHQGRADTGQPEATTPRACRHAISPEMSA